MLFCLNIFFKFGNIIILKNTTYSISAGIPSVTAICKYSLCALSGIALCTVIYLKLSSVKFRNIPYFKLSVPTPKNGCFPN